MSVDGFHHFWQFFLKKTQIKVSAYFYEITYLLWSTDTLFRELVFGDSNNCSKSSL